MDSPQKANKHIGFVEPDSFEQLSDGSESDRVLADLADKFYDPLRKVVFVGRGWRFCSICKKPNLTNQPFQTKPSKPNLPKQTYQTCQTKPTKPKHTKPNLPNQTYQTKHTKPNLLNQTYHTKPTKPNIPNQTYETKPAKQNLPNQAKPT